MDPKVYLLLGAVALVLAICCISLRREISFRFHFGVWQGQRGAERLVRERLKFFAKEVAAARMAKEEARDKFDKCSNLPAPMGASRKNLKKTERRERAIIRYYNKLGTLLKEFMMEGEMKIADEWIKIEIRELRKEQSMFRAVS